MNPGQDFSIGRPVVKGASFDLSVTDRNVGGGVEKQISA